MTCLHHANYRASHLNKLAMHPLMILGPTFGTKPGNVAFDTLVFKRTCTLLVWVVPPFRSCPRSGRKNYYSRLQWTCNSTSAILKTTIQLLVYGSIAATDSNFNVVCNICTCTVESSLYFNSQYVVLVLPISYLRMQISLTGFRLAAVLHCLYTSLQQFVLVLDLQLLYSYWWQSWL